MPNDYRKAHSELSRVHSSEWKRQEPNWVMI